MVDATVGEGKLFLYGPEVTNRAQPHGTFKLVFDGIYYGTASSSHATPRRDTRPAPESEYTLDAIPRVLLGVSQHKENTNGDWVGCRTHAEIIGRWSAVEACCRRRP